MSGRENLAQIESSGALKGLKLGLVDMTHVGGGVYLDGADGGGLIASVDPNLLIFEA